MLRMLPSRDTAAIVALTVKLVMLFNNLQLIKAQVDDLPPTVTCGPDIIQQIPIGSGGLLVNFTECTAVDNSGIANLISRSHSPGQFFAVDTTTIVTYTFTDPSGNTASANFSVTVQAVDVMPPIITCGPDIVRQTPISTGGLVVNFPECTAVDDSGIANLVSRSHSPPQFFAVDTTTLVTYTFTDPTGNTVSDSFSITIQGVDDLPPIVTCGPDIVRQTPVSTGGLVINFPECTAVDDSGTASLVSRSHSPGQFFAIGTTTVVTYTFIDATGNRASDSFSITVEGVDTVAPSITNCPVDDIPVTVELGETSGIGFWLPITATDLSGVSNLISQTASPGDNFIIGRTTVMYVFADASNNVANCEFAVVVTPIDTVAPVVSMCPNFIPETVELGLPGTIVNFPPPTATDVSGVVNVDSTHSPGTFFDVGVTSVSYTFTDGAGNSDMCTFVVNVGTMDTTPPVISGCPIQPVVVQVELGIPGTTVTWPTPTATDLSDPVTVVVNQSPGSFFLVGTMTITYTFTDAANNMNQCIFDVVVTTIDTTSPIISNCPTIIESVVELGVSGTMVDWMEPSATDESGVAEPTRSRDPNTFFIVGDTTVIYTFEDDSGNTAQCIFTVRVTTEDTTPLTVTCPDDIMVTIELGDPDPTITYADPTAFDLNPTMLIFQSHSSGDAFSDGVTTVTYVFSDTSSNTAVCTFDVTVVTVDTTPPTISNCPDTQIITVELGTGSGIGFWDEPTASDLSGTAFLESRTHMPGDSFLVGQTFVRYIFADSSMNQNICQFLVVVNTVDQQPQVVCPPDVSVIVELGVTRGVATWSDPVSADDSGMVSLVTQSHFSNSLFPLGETAVTYTYADNGGNIGTCTFNVIVTAQDNVSPVVSCIPDISETTLLGSGGRQVFFTEPTATDDSGIVSLQQRTQGPGTFFTTGETEVTYTFVDPAGNTAECTFIVIIIEDIDECNLVGGSPCTTPDICVNTLGSYQCECGTGFSGAPYSAGQQRTCTVIMDAGSSAVYLIVLVIPFLLLCIVVVIIFRRYQKKSRTDDELEDVQDANYENAGVTVDPEDYIALDEKSRNKATEEYQGLSGAVRHEKKIQETAVTSFIDKLQRRPEHRQSNYQYEDVHPDAASLNLATVPELDQQSQDESEYEVPEMFNEYAGVYVNTQNVINPSPPTPIKVTDFKNFMKRGRSEVIEEIIQQFMALQRGKQHPWNAALKLQNKPKNFFKSLLPYDHSRVKLDTDGSNGSSDYINASYIKNHHGKISFIAAQGPRDGTKGDFWNMVWQEDVETIVMLVDKSEIIEQQQYWPSKVDTSLRYGDITVLLMESTGFRTHTVRKMTLLKGYERVHILKQYEIPRWRYGGVPSEPTDLISVIKQIKTNQERNKHLLVHCSNGVGATGTFIALYDLMDVIQSKKEVSVFDVIKGMRKDRIAMVLTRLQYLFIFDALLEAMLSPDSQMSSDQLKKLDPQAIKKKAKKEFQMLKQSHQIDLDISLMAGSSPENKHKNRFQNLIPMDKYRPVLSSTGILFGFNDYVNATIVKDILEKDFIMTQSPLASTVEDFWRLVLDYDCTSIVMLNTIDDSDESLADYSPDGHNATGSLGLISVTCKKIDESEIFTKKQFQVNHKRSQKSVLVDHFSFHGWTGNKPDVSKLIEFIKYTKPKGPGPDLVHCINGVGLSAVYVTVVSELERMEKEGIVDVYGTVKRLRKKCPDAIPTEGEYCLCYQLLRDHLNHPNEYAVVF